MENSSNETFQDSRPLVHFITHLNAIEKNLPLYSLSHVRIEDIPIEKLKRIQDFCVNLDAFFNEELISLSTTFNPNRYINPLHDLVIKGCKILDILKSQKEIYLILTKEDDIDAWHEFLTLNNVCVNRPFKRDYHHFFTGAKRCKAFIKKGLSLLREFYWLKCKQLRLFFSRSSSSSPLFQKDKCNVVFLHWIHDKKSSMETLLHTSPYYGYILRDALAETKKNGGHFAVLGHILEGHADVRFILNTDFSFIKSYVSLKDILWAFYQSLKILKINYPEILSDGINYTSFVRASLKKDIFNGTLVSTLLLYRCFHKILKIIPQNTKFFYPFENHPYEKSLLLSKQKQKRQDIIFYAYQFFPIGQHFLIHQFSKKEKQQNLLPNCLLTSDIISDSFFQKQQITTIKVGNTRYNHLLISNTSDKHDTDEITIRSNEKKDTILCSLFLDPLEAIALTDHVINLSKKINCTFVINHHPLISKDLLTTLQHKILDKSNIKLSSQRASDLLDDDVLLLIYNSSSVFLDAALKSIPTLYMSCHNLPNLDRFHGLGESAQNVDNAILFIQKLIDDDLFYQKYAKNVYNNANHLLIKYDFHHIKDIFL